jgi:hypothetical protein
MENDELIKQSEDLINTLRTNTENINKILKKLNTIDKAIEYIKTLEIERKKCQDIHKEIFGKICCDDIKLPRINFRENEYESIEMKEIKNYLKNIYQVIGNSERIIEYIGKLKEILKQCKKNIFSEIENLKTNCDELIKTIKTTISTIKTEKENKLKENKLKDITDKHNYGDDLFTNYEKSLENYKKLKKIYDELELFNIEQFGKVKVYVKLRPISEEKKMDGAYKDHNNIIGIGYNKGEEIDDKKIKIKCSGKEKVYGPFKDICSGSNEDLFNMIKDDFTWEQIKGKTTILFSYGISGSGKSYTMFNNDEKDKGLIFRIFDSNFGYSNIKSKDVGSKFEVSVEEIFEHKILDEGFIQANGTEVTFDPTKLKGQKSPITFEKNQNIDEIIKNVTTSRIKNGTIKHTPNNPVSSRSHLFIVLKITKDGGKGYIVICDSAGRESPLEIAKSYYSDAASPSQIFQILNKSTSAAYKIKISNIPPEICKEDKNCKKYIKTLTGKYIEPKKDDPNFAYNKEINKYIQDIVKEGFFINESLNHMVKYLDENIKREKICIEKQDCNVSDYKLHEDKKDTVYTFRKLPDKDKKDDDDPIGTYTIFNELKNLSGEKYKFIMIANSRTEEDKCNSIQSTFDFVDKIKST